MVHVLYLSTLGRKITLCRCFVVTRRLVGLASQRSRSLELRRQDRTNRSGSGMMEAHLCQTSIRTGVDGVGSSENPTTARALQLIRLKMKGMPSLKVENGTTNSTHSKHVLLARWQVCQRQLSQPQRPPQVSIERATVMTDNWLPRQRQTWSQQHIWPHIQSAPQLKPN
jgi:hypothetical protein